MTCSHVPGPEPPRAAPRPWGTEHSLEPSGAPRSVCATQPPASEPPEPHPEAAPGLACRGSPGAPAVSCADHMTSQVALHPQTWGPLWLIENQPHSD